MKNKTFLLHLKKIVSKSYLKIITKPKGVEVYIDKTLIGLSDGRFEVKPGKHEIILRLEGYLDYLTEITIKKGETKTLELTLEKSP